MPLACSQYVFRTASHIHLGSFRPRIDTRYDLTTLSSASASSSSNKFPSNRISIRVSQNWYMACRDVDQMLPHSVTDSHARILNKQLFHTAFWLTLNLSSESDRNLTSSVLNSYLYHPISSQEPPSPLPLPLGYRAGMIQRIRKPGNAYKQAIRIVPGAVNNVPSLRQEIRDKA